MAKGSETTGNRAEPRQNLAIGLTVNDGEPVKPLPTVQLRLKLLRLSESYAWLVREWPAWIWSSQPDPVAACQTLGELDTALQALRGHCEEASEHVRRLWDLSFEESLRRERSEQDA